MSMQRHTNKKPVAVSLQIMIINQTPFYDSVECHKIQPCAGLLGPALATASEGSDSFLPVPLYGNLLPPARSTECGVGVHTYVCALSCPADPEPCEDHV